MLRRVVPAFPLAVAAQTRLLASDQNASRKTQQDMMGKTSSMSSVPHSETMKRTAANAHQFEDTAASVNKAFNERQSQSQKKRDLPFQHTSNKTSNTPRHDFSPEFPAGSAGMTGVNMNADLNFHRRHSSPHYESFSDSKMGRMMQRASAERSKDVPQSMPSGPGGFFASIANALRGKGSVSDTSASVPSRGDEYVVRTSDGTSADPDEVKERDLAHNGYRFYGVKKSANNKRS